MRRRTVHTLFAVLTLACAGATALPAWRWSEAERINAAVAEAQRPIAATTPDALQHLPPAVRDAPAPVRLARATALAAAGAYDAAFKSYAALIQDQAGRPVAADALYNLGNMYLRQGLRVPLVAAPTPSPAPSAAAASGSDGSASAPQDAVAPPSTAAAEPPPSSATTVLSPEAAPLVELAKQRYRDLLRLAPESWDARYNLERALRLAPEAEPPAAREANVPAERRQVMLRGMEPGDLP